MIRGGSGRLSRRLSIAGVAMYALFLIASPFEHHDLQCELKTPQHCTSCTSSLLSSYPQSGLNPGDGHLPDAGRAFAIQLLGEDTLLAVRSTGRSPPVAL